MLVIKSHTNDPYFNIAAEEYLLHHFTDDLLFLYINNVSIIVGKHQNALAETNYKYCIENKIPIIRRYSGGGTVYHDLGNLNYSFFTYAKEGAQINFKKFAAPIIETLKQLGIEAKQEGKNDIRVDGLKISGNAGHVYINKALHHGTLLVNANLEMLSQSLKVVEGKYKDKAVKSVRSEVANLITINTQITTKKFIQNLVENVKGEIIEFSNDDIESINQQVAKKYSTWDWNFGYSPEYSFFGKLNDEPFELIVKDGIIKRVNILNNDFLKANLIGQKHELYAIKKILISSLNLDESDAESLAWKFF
jgi:lipoate---protein ligase